MKGILLHTVNLGGKKYAYNDINKGIIASSFRVDKFYGGRVTRFGKTSGGLYLCLEKNLEDVIDIFVDFDNLSEMKVSTLKAIAAIVKDRKLRNTPKEEKEAMEAQLEIPAEATKAELAEYITTYAIDTLTDG